MNKWLCCALLVVSRGQEAADHLGSGPPLRLMGTKPGYLWKELGFGWNSKPLSSYSRLPWIVNGFSMKSSC